MALAALLAASCAKESSQKETSLPKVAISVEASVSGLTKAVTEGTQTSFVADDQLTLYAWTGSNTAVPDKKVVNGVVNTYDGTTWTPASTMLWKNVQDAHYFLGISPARTVTNFTTYPVTSAEDLLVATILGDGLVAPQTVTASPVNLEFSHVMAVLKVNVKYRNQWGGVPEAVVKAVAAPAGTIDFLTKAITPGTVSTQTLSSFTAATGYDATYSSLCIPQAFRTLEFTIAGQTLVYTHDADIQLEAGKVTTLSVLVGKDKLSLEANTVSDWDEGEVNPNMEPGSAVLANTSRPLTLKAKEDGTTVSFLNKSSDVVNWVTSDGRTGSVSVVGYISLSAGQRVWFLGTGANNAFGANTSALSSRIGMTKDCEVYGNIMSLLDKDFATATTLPAANTFAYLFDEQTHLVNSAEEGLILPATTLTNGCYRGLFKGCTAFSKVIVDATTISATDCLTEWLDGVPGTGFELVTPNPLQWKMGDTLPWGATVYTQGESGPEAVYTTPTALANALTYNTAAQTLINAGTAHKDGVVLEYSTDGNAWSTTVPTGTNAGNYNVYCRVQSGGVTSAAIPVTIAPKTVTSPTITLATTVYTYDGSAKTPAVSSVKDGSTTIPSGEYTVSYSNNTNAGTATVTISDKTGGNYQVSGTKNFTINKVPCSIVSAPTAKSLTFNGSRSNYNGSSQVLVNAGSASGGTMRYKVGNGSWSESLPSATNAGTYTVYYKAAGSNSNYADSAEGSIQVTIAKANGWIEPTNTSWTPNVFGGYQDTVYASGTLTGSVMSNGAKSLIINSNNTTPPSYSVTMNAAGPSSYTIITYNCAETTNYKAAERDLNLQ